MGWLCSFAIIFSHKYFDISICLDYICHCIIISMYDGVIPQYLMQPFGECEK